MNIAAHVEAQTDRLHRRLTDHDAAIEAELDRMLDAAIGDPAALYSLGGYIHDAPMLLHGESTTVERGLLELQSMVYREADYQATLDLSIAIHESIAARLRVLLRHEAAQRVAADRADTMREAV